MMSDKENKSVTRREFMRDSALLAAGLSSALAGCKGKQEKEPNTAEPSPPRREVEAGAPRIEAEKKYPQVPRRKLGKTGVEIPSLSLGTMFNLVDNQIVLRSTLQYGVNYWDTSNVYAGGNSELGIGKFLSRNPDVRKKVFIATKAKGAYTKEAMEQRLRLSLSRMKTDYVDLHYFHDLQDPSLLTDQIRQYVESAKKRGLIRFFGFTTHKNMVQCLNAGAKLDWIDVIMSMYNFRVMQDPQMQAAIDACHEANIGLLAMKTTGMTTITRFRVGIETEQDKKMVQHFIQRGFTPEQAGIKFALEDKRISSACVQMENINILKMNVATALDKTELTEQDKKVLSEYARATCSGYCAGCAHICDSVLPDVPYLSDIMRYLMYYNSYGDTERARRLFAQIPTRIKSKLLSIDYSMAEAHCPQHMPIAELVAEAVRKLA